MGKDRREEIRAAQAAHEMEQLGAKARELAPMLAGMYAGLVKNDVPGGHAAVIVGTFLAQMVGGSTSND